MLSKCYHILLIFVMVTLQTFSLCCLFPPPGPAPAPAPPPKPVQTTVQASTAPITTRTPATTPSTVANEAATVATRNGTTDVTATPMGRKGVTTQWLHQMFSRDRADQLQAWSEWSQCPIDTLRVCPLVQKRWRICPLATCSDGLGDIQQRICSYSACLNNLYQHTLMDGFCSPVGSVQTMAGYVSNPSVCANACNEFRECRGFTYSQRQRTCWLEAQWCEHHERQFDGELVSYEKIVPDGFDCGLGECVDHESSQAKLTTVKGLETWLDCGRVCKSIEICWSFVWGPGPMVRISDSEYYLDCHLYSTPQCPQLMASIRARFCQKRSALTTTTAHSTPLNSQ